MRWKLRDYEILREKRKENKRIKKQKKKIHKRNNKGHKHILCIKLESVCKAQQ